MQASSAAASPLNYALSSDLARLSLPQEYRDANRLLAWVNSICCAFLVIGIVGLKAPKVRIKPLTEVVDIVPVVITPPEELPRHESAEPTEEVVETTEVMTDTPVVATVVAANATAAAFAVPVEGPVILAPMRYAPPPPRDLRPPPTPRGDPTKYVPSVGDWGGNPAPKYPPLALRMGYQGKVVLLIAVDASGAVTSVEVKTSSGYKILDEAALEHVRAHLRLRNAPGEVRHHTLDIVFQLSR